MNITRRFVLLLVFLATVSMMVLFAKGRVGNGVYYQSEKDISVGGPFELSNSTGRYALTEAIAKDHTFFLDNDLAKFASPDVVDYKGHFFSIFTPGVSFIGLPFYELGSLFGLPQVFSFFGVSLFAVLNVFLIFLISRKLGASFYASIASGLVFIFATNGLSYALNFTQHQLSTTVVLLGILNALYKRSLASDFVFGLIVAAGALFDIPNLFLIAPVAIYIFIKHFDLARVNRTIKFSIRWSFFAIIIGIIPLASLFAWYNFKTAGSFSKLGQTIGRTGYFRNNQPARNSAEGPTSESKDKNPFTTLPFATRNQLNSLYILVFSNERSWLFYSPILYLGLAGWGLAFVKKQRRDLAVLAISVISVNLVLYSMFDDPWGGWAFGARYLIPAAAVAAGGIGFAIDKLRRNYLFVGAFIILVGYSVFVNVAGALTTSAIPPKIEAKNLGYDIPYTYKYNFQLIDRNFSSSLVYNAFLSDKMPARNYLAMLSLIASGLILGFFALALEGKKKEGA